MNEKKIIAILGDSISTKEGLNVSEILISKEDVGITLKAYPTFYDIGKVINGYTIKKEDIGSELEFTPSASDVGKSIGDPLNYNTTVSKVWWEYLEEEFNVEVIPACWSGSSYTTHENNLPELINSYAWHDSQIRKLGKRVDGTPNRISPDVIILYRGCNDMTHSPYSVLTKDYFDRVDWKYPLNDDTKDGIGLLEALSKTVQKIRNAYPKARIVIATQTAFKRINCDNFPSNNGLYNLPKLNKELRNAADFFGCHTIDFDKCGITFENCYASGYVTDSIVNPTHPNDFGHELMGRLAVIDLKNKLGFK